MPDWDNLTLNGYYASDFVICPSNVDILNFNELKYVLNQIKIEKIDILVFVMLNSFNPLKSNKEELYSNHIFNHFKADKSISEALLKIIIPKSVSYERMVVDKEFNLTQQLFNPFERNLFGLIFIFLEVIMAGIKFSYLIAQNLEFFFY